MTFRVAIVLALAIPVTSPALFAHHSFEGEFDNSTAVTLRGRVARVEMVNPHSFIYLDVTSAAGSERWAIEGPGPTQATRRGFAADFVKASDTLDVCGYLAKRDVVTTRTDPVTGGVVRKLSGAVLTLPKREPFVWSNYRQQKCGLDR